MIKTFTKLFSLAVAVAVAVVCSGFNVNASAAELESQVLEPIEFENNVFLKTKLNQGVNDTAPGIGDLNIVDPNQMVTYGTNKPSSVLNLSTYGRKTFAGYLNSARSLYTNNLYTGKSTFKIFVRNNDNQNLTFKVMRKDLIFDNKIGPSYGIVAGGSRTITVSVDSSKKYYLEFIGPCDISGWIE